MLTTVVIREIDIKNELEIASKLLSEAFSKDPFFQLLFDDKTRRDKTQSFFKFFLKSNILLKDKVLLALVNEEIAGVCSFSSPKENNRIPGNMLFLFDTLLLMFRIGFNPFFKLNRYFKLILETQHPELYYLNFIGVSDSYRGKGIAKSLMGFVHNLVESDKEFSEIGLDTENHKNVEYYKRFGYQLIDHKKLDKITIYCMRNKF